MAVPSIALPGQLLGPADKFLPGPGTHIHDSQIYASIAGPVISSPFPNTASTTKPTISTATSKPLPLLSISRPDTTTDPGILGTASGGGGTILPTIDAEVLARVTRLGPRSATLEILCISSHVCHSPFQAQIRREDIRATEKDKIKIEESFRVGDIVKGVVISLGDQSNYYVSTARNDLGVVLARSEGAGRVMYPVSWREFADPVTGGREARKAAKPL